MIWVMRMADNSRISKKIVHSLKTIERRLDILIALQKRVTPMPSIGEEENKILNLCNMKNTIDDIMEKTGKRRSNIKNVLFHLRNKGLIVSARAKDKKTVYERI